MTFLAPWLLSALLLLPLVYLLLRIIPPAAKKIVLPTTRFLHNLVQKNPPVQKTPWWLILLRLAMLACLIIGLAHPLLHPEEKLTGSGRITLVLDNGWASSQTWAQQQEAALKIAVQAKRDQRPLELILTAPLAGEENPQVFPANSPDQIISQIKGLIPSAWPGLPGQVRLPEEGSVFWVTAGLAEQGFAGLLKARPDMTVFVPEATRWPLLLRPADEDDNRSIARVEAPSGFPASQVQVRALDRKGENIDQVALTIKGGQGYVDALSGINGASLKDITSIRLASRNGAGAVILKDKTNVNRKIGMLTPEGAKDTQNLNSPLYYISRAVAPFATFTTGPGEKLLAENPGLIVLAEGGALPPATLESFTGWIENGGILLRFATPALADGSDTFSPVRLRDSARSLNGSLTWDNPLTVKTFTATSPFAQLAVPKDIKIVRQLLAEPGPELNERIWATLSDDTPLITARPMGKGLLVLVHTNAIPDWSDLPLSGFYVDIFKTLLELTSRSDKASSEAVLLQPLAILNGYGQLVQPPAIIKPVERAKFASTQPSSLTPPGFYGTAEESFALNLGDRLPPLEPLAAHLKTEQLMTMEGIQEFDAAPYFLGAALALFLIDLAILLVISGLLLKLRWLLPIMLLFAAPARANDADLAGQIHLAYIRTGDAVLDDASQRGLENLSRDLIDRTAVEPGAVVGVTPGKDTLAFYPLLYWPVSTSQQNLSSDAAKALQAYLDLGGMILIDTRDGMYQPSQTGTSAQIQRLRGLLGPVSLSPMIAAPESHVFFKTFYLLNVYPELSLNGDIWVEEDSTEEGGQVSSVVLTGQDWARIWSADQGSVPRSQKEQATRFGINAVMYALTGNYKTDQIHMNAVLNRLGREERGTP